jgi:transcription-repair coupling factor (superfamily II helicase)
MALDGIRDFSIIATPPQKRLAINTQIILDDDHIIKDAITRETRRGGQVYFLYNDVRNINAMLIRLNKLLPELQIAVAHGQMNEHLLEQTIRDFILQRYHILLCSTIVESGIDIPNANTIIIYGATGFGLATLYQLRGRVGRSTQQAYCYLVTPETVSIDANKRLDAIKATSELGAGFNLAMHDLEIRGAGEILGDTQSGDIKELGLSLYTDILKKTIKRLKAQANNLPTIDSTELNCEVNFNATAIIPDTYCHEIHERLIYYKRLARATSNNDIDTIYQDLMDKFGLPTMEIKTLIASHQLRLLGLSLGITRIDTTNNKITLTFMDKPNLAIETMIKVMQELKTCKYDGKNKLIWTIAATNVEDKIINTNLILNKLCN